MRKLGMFPVKKLRKTYKSKPYEQIDTQLCFCYCKLRCCKARRELLKRNF